MKVVLNRAFGGFSVSRKCAERMAELGHDGAKDALAGERFYSHFIEDNIAGRSDKILLQVIEELGAEANGDCASLGVVEIPDGVHAYIDDYDGIETVREHHESWP